MTHIKTLLAAGKRYEWSVTEPDVHISGNTAWIAYVNKGSITDARRHNQPDVVGIGRPAETGRELEDREFLSHGTTYVSQTYSREARAFAATVSPAN